MIDSLVLVGENRHGPTIHLSSVSTVARSIGIEHTLVAPALPVNRDLTAANLALSKAVNAEPHGVSFVARLDPLLPDISKQIALAIERRAVAVFLHPAEEGFAVRQAIEAVRALASAGLPAIIAGGFYGQSEPLQLMELAHAVPEVSVVMTTGGQMNISGLSLADAWAALERTENLFVMTNGEYRQDFIERLAHDLDDRRVIWGSFAPVYDRAFEAQRIRHARLTEASRRRIEVENARRLFRLCP